MKKLIIFEIDNVLADRDGALAKLLREAGDDLEGFIQNPNIYYGMKQIAPMVKLLKKVSQAGYPVAILSKRPTQALNFTKRWVKACDLNVDFVFIETAKDKLAFLEGTKDLEGIKDAIEFIVESDIVSFEKLARAGYTVYSYSENVIFGLGGRVKSGYRKPCLYTQSDGTVMLWERDDEEAIPLLEHLASRV